MQRSIFWFCTLLVVLFAIGCAGNHGSLPSNPTWNIRPEGGTFQTASGEARLVVPAGAVSSNRRVTVTKLATAPTPPTGTTYVPGTGWSFTHVDFALPASLTLTFPTGTPADSVKMYRRADGTTTWNEVPTTVNAANRTATAAVSSFSSYALFTTAGSGWEWTSAGGTFLFEMLTVTLPADAVATQVEVQARRTPAPFAPPPGWNAIAGATYDLGSSNTSLETAHPFTVGMVYVEGAVPAAARDNVRIFYKENETSEWMALTSTAVAAELKVSATSSTLGTFAAFYPTPSTAGAYWVEQRSAGGNNIFLDVYSAEAGGTENLAYSPTQMQGQSQLRVNTFRWADKSFLGLDFASASETFLMSYNVATGASTRLFPLPHDAGTFLESVEPARARGIAGSDDYAVQVSQRNGITFEARDRLLLFLNGSTEPQVLLSHDRTDGESPAIMRPWDVAADGRVLALTSLGLVMFTGTSQFVIADAESGAAEAFFSPSGNRILYVQNSGAEAGWRVYNLTTHTSTPIVGLTNGIRVRWGADDNHVIEAQPFGDTRHINLVDITTGASSRIVTAGGRENTFINDVGIR
ncbi:MAG: hypothetical protein ACO1SV_19030 [Fimbriimonas sp.]